VEALYLCHLLDVWICAISDTSVASACRALHHQGVRKSNK